MDMQSWLAGVIDGEGCFQIGDDGHAILTVMVAHCDRGMIDKCWKAAGKIGTVRNYPKNQANRVPVSCWNVKSKRDTATLVALLEKHPLQSKKAKEFKLWKKAVEINALRRVGGNHAKTRVHNAPLKAKLMRLRAQLMALHKPEHPRT